MKKFFILIIIIFTILFQFINEVNTQFAPSDGDTAPKNEGVAPASGTTALKDGGTVPGTAPIDGGTATVHQKMGSSFRNCTTVIRINRSFKAIATLGPNDNEIEKLF
ncbi:unnamed protein product [Rhizophagus irregularis]|nr:unnamed protein product [Rhizophagus irregularis]